MPDAVDARALLVGAGGHARVCLEILEATPGTTVVGAVSRDGSGVDRLGTPVIGRHRDLQELAERERVDTLCVAIGDNKIRREVLRNLTERGWLITTLVSHAATVSPSAELRAGCQVMPGAVINAAAQLGPGTIVNTNASVDHDAVIGECVHIAPGSVLGGDVTVGDEALVGLGAMVLPGRSIGASAVVGAGAVVVDDVAPGSVVVGVPARSRSSVAR